MNQIFCQHGGERGKPYYNIDIGDDDTILTLCRSCYEHIRGYILHDVLKSSIQQAVKEQLKGVKIDA